MKKIVIISSSLRRGSNSHIVAERIAAGAREGGADAEVVSLAGKEIKFCIGCLSCQKTLKCVLRDDAPGIVAKIQAADALVFATPIYYYELAGQLKTLLDRCNPLYPSDYAFRDVYLASTSAEEGEAASESAINGLKGWIACFPKARYAGAFIAGGLNDPREVESRADVLERAFEFGSRL